MPESNAMSVPAPTKIQLRRQLRQARQSLSPSARRRAEQQVSRCLKSCCKRGRRLGIYLAAGSELNLQPLFQAALKRGTRLYAPFIEPRQRRLWFTPYPPKTAAISRSIHGIAQFEGRKIRIERLHTVLLPLVGVDERGVRLGQGGGYYDASLAAARRTLGPRRVGVGFACQLCAKIPAEAHDMRLDAFVSEHGWRHFVRKA